MTETVRPPELQTLSCGPAFTETCADQDVECASATVCASEQLSVNQARPVPLSNPPPPTPTPSQADSRAAAPALCRAPGERAGEALRGGPCPAQPAALRPPEAAMECRLDSGADLRGPSDQRGNPHLGRHQATSSYFARVSQGGLSLVLPWLMKAGVSAA